MARQKSTYGYKAHMNVDEDGFVKATSYTAGNVHDADCFTELLSSKESSVYADSAYQSKAHRQWLIDRKIDNRIIKRAYRNRPLTQQEKQFNWQHFGVRCTVERVFGVLKQHYGLAKARYLGVRRNQVRCALICVAHNIKRGVSIQRSCA